MVADGYKDTEIGVIPIEWDVIEVGKHTKLMGGYAFKSKDAKELGTRWLKIANVGIKKIKWEQVSYLEDAYQEEYKKFLLKKNDIVLAMTRPILSMKLKIAKITNDDIPALLNQRVGKFIFDDKVNDEFMYQLFQHIDFVKLLMLKIMGTDPPNVSSEQLESIKIPLPPLKEQEKIADILSTADEKIDAIASQIEKAQTLKKGLLQKLLSEGIGHSEFKDSELGKIPESWEVGKLEDILTIKYGKSQKDVEDINGEYPILGTGGIMGYANNYLCNKPSVLIGRKGTIDKPQYMETPFWTVDTLFYTELKKDILPKFVYYIFQTIHWKKYNEASGVPSLSKPNIHNIATVLLPLEEQKQIADILSTADEKLEVLRAKKQMYETLKKGLLQKLLSGEVRV